MNTIIEHEEEYGLYFPSTGGGNTSGINDTGIETFNDDPLNSLVRETIQNSLDELSTTALNPVNVEFKLHYISRNQFPYIADFKIMLESCNDYCIKYNNSDSKTISTIDNALDVLSKDTIPVLEVADFNTTGLKDAEKKTGNFHKLVRSSGLSNKGEGKGGSFGIGKNAPFSCSTLRSVFYSSLDESNIQAFQGVSKWCTHIHEDLEMQPIGYLGIKKIKGKSTEFLPFVNKPSSNKSFPNIDKLFIRNEIGTSLFVIGFNHSENWKYDIVRYTVQNYFIAIHENNLTVNVGGIHINKRSLKLIIDTYFNINNYDDKLIFTYYNILLNAEVKYLSIFDEKDARLYLSTDDNLPRKIAYIRSNGMKILDIQGIGTTESFVGILKFEGLKINTFIKDLENPRHDTLSASRYGTTDKERKEAENKLKEIKKLIREEVKSRTNNNDLSISNMFWLGNIFPAEDTSSYDIKTSENIHKSITNILNKSIKEIPKSKRNISDSTDTTSDGGSKGTGSGGSKGTTSGGKSTTKPIDIKYSRIFKASNNEYYTTYIQSSNSCNTFLEIRIIGEDGRWEPANILSASDPADKLYKLYNSKKISSIGPIKFKKNETKEIRIKLSGNKNYSLEVLSCENNI